MIGGAGAGHVAGGGGAPARHLPLDGVRVLDLSRLLPGGFCSLLLADFGADVVKVEDTGMGDYVRWSPPYYEGADDSAKSAYFLGLNRNKRSIRIDLKKDEGKAVLLRLARDYDVLLESFRQRVIALIPQPLRQVQVLLLLGDRVRAEVARPRDQRGDAERHDRPEHRLQHAPRQFPADRAGKSLEHRAGQVVGRGRRVDRDLGGLELAQGRRTPRSALRRWRHLPL